MCDDFNDNEFHMVVEKCSFTLFYQNTFSLIIFTKYKSEFPKFVKYNPSALAAFDSNSYLNSNILLSLFFQLNYECGKSYL